MTEQPRALTPGEGRVTGHDGVRLHYRVSGSGPPLIAHPGGPGTSAAYLGDLAGLDEVATIIWLDPRGTGGSTAPDDPAAYKLAHYAADVEALCDGLGLDRVALLGFSHGGMVAMRLAIDHPARLTRLILLDTAPALDEAAGVRIAAAMDRRQGEPWYAEARRLIDADETAADDIQATAEMLAIMPMYFHRWDAVGQAFIGSLAGSIFHSRTGPSWAEEQPAMDLRPELDRIRTPTLVVVGDDDFICDVTAAHEMADGIPGADLAVIAEAGHFPWVEQPGAFRRVVDEFLTGR
ncbi:MAG TPA: alpha/beta hydrolase [Candidatus Limnocylindria bacterium]|jgi:proline iminopeptidase